MTVRTRAQLNSDADTLLADNTAGEISPQDVRERVKDLADSAIPPMKGYFYGLTLSNNTTDATNDIDIATGEAADSTGDDRLILASALIKKLDAAWAVGTNQGMLDGTESVAGTPDVSTWYHIWLIKRPDTGVVDVLASESATAPTMPDAAYTLKVWLGAVYNDSSGNIRAFYQNPANPDEFRWVSCIEDVLAVNPGTAAVTRTLSVPTGIVVSADILLGAVNGTTAQVYILASSLAVADVTPSATVYNGKANSTSAFSEYTSLSIPTNTSAQIRTRHNVSAAFDQTIILTLGWTRKRGAA